MALHKRLWTRDDLETRDIDPVDVGLAICGPRSSSSSPPRRILKHSKKILHGACHVIYVRLNSLRHRTHDRHSSTTLQASLSHMRCSKLLHKKLSLLFDVVERPVTMTTPLKEQAWQSGLVLLDETPEWNENDWPPLEGGWREGHASVVIDHPHTDNHKRQTVVVLGGRQQGKGTTDSVLVLNLAESHE